MIIAVISDLHANWEATQAVFRELDTIQPGGIVCLGDLVGYNASPNEVVDFIRHRNIPCVMGNHDAACSGLEEPWFFRSGAKKAIQWTLNELRDDNKQYLRGLREQIRFKGFCLGVHGSPANRDDYIIDWLDAMRAMEHLDGKELRLCFFGHSHRVSLFSEQGAVQIPTAPSSRQTLNGHGRYFINPGAVGQPRDHDPRAAYLLFDTQSLTLEFRRVEYDIESAQRRIVDAGLPPELAKRLAKGK